MRTKSIPEKPNPDGKTGNKTSAICRWILLIPAVYVVGCIVKFPLYYFLSLIIDLNVSEFLSWTLLFFYAVMCGIAVTVTAAAIAPKGKKIVAAIFSVLALVGLIFLIITEIINDRDLYSSVFFMITPSVGLFMGSFTVTAYLFAGKDGEVSSEGATLDELPS